MARKTNKGVALMAKKKKQLTKSSDKIVSGVFGGIAEYFGWDKTIVRLIGAFLIIFPGTFVSGVVLYVIAAMVMPDPTQGNGGQSDDDDDSVIEGEFREK